MNEESLVKARDEIIKALEKADIDNADRLELIINIYHFLDEKKYESNIKTLRLRNESRKSN